jgi:hypothetical protein
VDARSLTNTSAPTDGSPWASVGYVNGASCTYLGAGWVLTAAHVGAGNAEFGGVLYPWDGTSVRLTNSDRTSTDMVMFHLASLPPLPRIALSTTVPASTSTVDMMGFGCIAGAGVTNFGSYSGFYWSSSGFKSWGDNHPTGGTSVINSQNGNVTVFSTTFNSSSQTANECEAAAGDSGGAVFIKSGSTWQLTGMVAAISTIVGQSNNASVYGQSTYCAAISTYRPQMISLITNTIPSLFISGIDTNVLVSWTDTGVSNRLASNPLLTTTNWKVLSPSLVLTNGQYCALLPVTTNALFFRLQKP